MRTIKAIFKSVSGWIWFSVSIILIAVMIVASILTTTTFRTIINTVLGGPVPIYNEDVERIYKSDYNNKDEVLQAGKALNIEIAQEGTVLLLNENINGVPALPMSKNSKVSVFGKNSVDLVLSGSGSGDSGTEGASTIFDGLEAGDFQYNKVLRNFYESSASGAGRSSNPDLSEGATIAPTLDIGETPIINYTPEVMASFRDYNDAAIVVISRIGGESFDLPRSQNTKSGGIEGNHYLQLDNNEYDLLDMVTARFDKVIVVLNTLTSFQLDFIAQYNNTTLNKRIDAVMWIGGPGINGAEGIGSLLNGDVNPSGKTVDIYSRDFTLDPTWKNFGDNSQNFNGTPSAAFVRNGENVADDFMVSYEEGVYVGYRYYETRGHEESIVNPASNWYEDNVVFPLGYGLSYTEFQQTITISNSIEDGVEVEVTVENTGSIPGKDTVQLYVTLPYISGEIEKSHVQLVDFAKTELLQPQGTQSFTFKVKAYDLASYDYNDANGNEHFGYELDAGEYTFYVSENSHVDENAYAQASLILEESITFTNDPLTGKPVVNRFTSDDFDDMQYRLSDVYVNTQNGEAVRKGMSRTDFEGTFPSAPDVDEREYLEGEEAALDNRSHNNTEITSVTDTQITGIDGNTVLRDLHGKDYDDDLWTELLNRLTYDEMLSLVNNGAFQTVGILSIGKNLTNDSDGPVGFVNFMPGLESHYKGNPSFASEIVIASTWSKDLAYRMGKMVGETGVWGDVNGNGLPYTGWYAPAVNIHRSPFSGRNYEYYSEDSVLSGKMAVNVINGAGQKGVYTDLKHFALNDQETNRAGVATYCTEQAFREIYLKPFEMSVKGMDDPSLVPTATKDSIVSFKGTTGIMSSFNRVGTRWTGGDYRLMTTILRVEWGFNGLVICDYKTDNSVMDSRQMLYAGNDLILASLPNLLWNDSDSSNIQDMVILRQASHNILFTVANSNSINVDVIGYGTERWIIVMIILEVVITIGLAVWGFFTIRTTLKNQNLKPKAD